MLEVEQTIIYIQNITHSVSPPTRTDSPGDKTMVLLLKKQIKKKRRIDVFPSCISSLYFINDVKKQAMYIIIQLKGKNTTEKLHKTSPKPIFLRTTFYWCLLSLMSSKNHCKVESYVYCACMSLTVQVQMYIFFIFYMFIRFYIQVNLRGYICNV